jgi:hypothetical protein
MLQPTEYFHANEVRFLQAEAAEWIQYVNEKIIAAAGEGQYEVFIDISERDPIGKKYWQAPNALIEHFKSRGFTHQFNGQCSTIFKWAIVMEETKEFLNIKSIPDSFEFNGEPVDGKGLKERIKNFLFGDHKNDANA